MQLETMEKFKFLDLLLYIADIDDDFDIKEANIISDYCQEMGIENREIEGDFDLEETLRAFKSKKSQKIVFLEVNALFFIDDNFDPKEQEINRKMVEIFNLDKNLAKIMSLWGKNLASLYGQATIFLEND